MRINNNIMALNAHRQLGINQANSSKSMEKLSSGFRINRAGDDAAGLAISEKMRGQIRGLKQAARNAQDGISLIQTAEGALNETHAILQRMRELAVQSSTDTNTTEDREEIQKEIDQLATEITRIATDTEFNTQNLLGGEFKAKFHIGANKGQNVSLEIGAMDADTLGVAAEPGVEYTVTATVTPGTDGSGENKAVNFANGTYQIVEIGDYEGTELVDGEVEGGASAVTHVLVDGDGNAVGTSVDGTTYHAIGAVGAGEGSDATRAAVTIDATATEVTIADTVATTTLVVDFAGDATIAAGTYTVVSDGGTGFELHSEAGDVVATSTDGATWVNADSETLFTTNTLAADAELEVTSGGIDVSSQEAADIAIKTINSALEEVSSERSKLGAMQNRLEHTIANLGTSAENLQAAESRIRDLDMAEEIMAFTKNNILQQAATAMLAQANMAPQSVLQLLG